MRLGSTDGLPVALDLVGMFNNGSRTGSSKADAYLWAKETFLDTGEVYGDTLGYDTCSPSSRHLYTLAFSPCV